jgi:hypothetical protein
MGVPPPSTTQGTGMMVVPPPSTTQGEGMMVVPPPSTTQGEGMMGVRGEGAVGVGHSSTHQPPPPSQTYTTPSFLHMFQYKVEDGTCVPASR